MKVASAILAVIIGLLGCNEQSSVEPQSTTAKALIWTPEFKAIFEGQENPTSYAVFDSTVRFITDHGILEKEYSKNDQKITVFMVDSSLVQGLNAEFILKDEELVCTTCTLFNLDSNWARTYKHDAYYQSY